MFTETSTANPLFFFLRGSESKKRPEFIVKESEPRLVNLYQIPYVYIFLNCASSGVLAEVNVGYSMLVSICNDHKCYTFVVM